MRIVGRILIGLSVGFFTGWIVGLLIILVGTYLNISNVGGEWFVWGFIGPVFGSVIGLIVGIAAGVFHSIASRRIIGVITGGVIGAGFGIHNLSYFWECFVCGSVIGLAAGDLVGRVIVRFETPR